MALYVSTAVYFSVTAVIIFFSNCIYCFVTHFRVYFKITIFANVGSIDANKSNATLSHSRQLPSASDCQYSSKSNSDSTGVHFSLEKRYYCSVECRLYRVMKTSHFYWTNSHQTFLFFLHFNLYTALSKLISNLSFVIYDFCFVLYWGTNKMLIIITRLFGCWWTRTCARTAC